MEASIEPRGDDKSLGLLSMTPGPTADVLPPESPMERFGRLRAEGRRKAEAGDLERALEHLTEALEVAENMGDAELVALARCNRAAVAVQLGEFGEHLADLRMILMRNYSAETSFAAAYNLSVAHEFQKDHKKALFYARIARDRSLASGQDDYLAKSYNQIAGGLSAQSFFDGAVAEYDKALRLLGDRMTEVRAMAMTNLAYCRLVLGDYSAGFEDLFRCLRWYKRMGQRLYLAWPHLMLCFGYLEIGRLRYAWKHGRKALEFAEAAGQVDAVKNALFLLGEVEKAAGDWSTAYEYFNEMQRRFYPENPGLPAAVSVVGMTQLVNLRA